MALPSGAAASALLIILASAFPGLMCRAEEEVECTTVRTRGGTLRPAPCVFPFTYDGNVYEGCTKVGDPRGRSWCSVEVDAEGNHVVGAGRWGHCSKQTCNGNEREKATSNNSAVKKGTCRTDSSPSSRSKDRPCVFPFSFGGKRYDACTSDSDRDGQHWCATQVDGDGELVLGQWGYCDEVSCFGRHLLPDLDSCYLHRDTGTRFVTRGEDASVFEFPFAALIGYTHPTGDFDGIKYLCGGTLINNRYVLTAAHCVIPTNDNPQEAEEVLLGETDFSKEVDCTESLEKKECGSKPQRIAIDKVIPHESYKNAYPFHNDVALVRLAERARLNNSTRPVCLPVDLKAAAGKIDNLESLERLEGASARVVGWGRTNFRSTGDLKQFDVSSRVLQKAALPVLPGADCRGFFGARRYSNGTVFAEAVDTRSQFCAGGLDANGRDSCSGDSGGPLLAVGGNENMIQIGIVSFGSTNCGNGVLPGVYTRVTAYLEWVYKHLRP